VRFFCTRARKLSWSHLQIYCFRSLTTLTAGAMTPPSMSIGQRLLSFCTLICFSMALSHLFACYISINVSKGKVFVGFNAVIYFNVFYIVNRRNISTVQTSQKATGWTVTKKSSYWHMQRIFASNSFICTETGSHFVLTHWMNFKWRYLGFNRFTSFPLVIIAIYRPVIDRQLQPNVISSHPLFCFTNDL